ncbi:MAG: OmpA family protein [Holophagaceae bacterium]|uniref:OmpA family protein n=1 Tax=Candidatus Geothrix skivensis TaxID=2954439 RepID=A0A9D7SJN8_9BACT|nr:OmpA family protein [Candidatus Geothrix skivensis]
MKEVVKPVPPPPAKIVLDEAVLHFANGKAELGAEAITAIQKVAEGLKAYPGSYSLEVSGHTSSIGGKALNKALAKRRADAVAKVLVDAGIPAAKVSTVGVGPDKPIADNASKEGQSKNRRVEIDVKVDDGKVEVRKTATGTVEAPAPAPAPKKPAKKAVK